MKRPAEIDRALSEAVETRQVPGVVAFATTRDAPLYEGAFGVQSLADPAPMTQESIFWIASMTKAITATAAMQLVERGKLSLDRPAGEIVAGLQAPQVLEGFDAAGGPRLRPARRTVTLRHLLTHTSGFVYENWNANLARYAKLTGLPGPSSGDLGAFAAPLGFEPGERWEYGIGIDWVGRMVEAASGEALDVYFRKHIFEPLAMKDTAYVLRPDQAARMVAVHARGAGGALTPIERQVPQEWEFFPGGGALFSTGGDYLSFLRMLLNRGKAGGAVVLRPETVALMGENHMGALTVQPLRTVNPQFSNDAEFFPGMAKKWGLSFLINTEDAPTGRSAGSLAWAGLANTYFWLDPKRGVAGVLLTQILPFADPAVMRLFETFETAIYRSLP
jgi:methyl acetate hydrolase